MVEVGHGTIFSIEHGRGKERLNNGTNSKIKYFTI